MEPKLIRYPHIEEFRKALPDIENNLRYRGKGKDGKAVFDRGALDPITLEGTWKIHGSCSSVAQAENGTMWAQNRRIVLGAGSKDDNHGFGLFFEKNREAFRRIFDSLRKAGVTGMICVFGEFFGKDIQNGVGVSKIEPSFAIFDVSRAPEGGGKQWLPDDVWASLHDHEARIWNVREFGQPDPVLLDFARPEECAAKMEEVTRAVAAHCPVAEHFGIDGTGEGVVWKWRAPNGAVMRIKTKSDKFSASIKKNMRLVEVDPVQVKSAEEFCQRVLGGTRLAQALDEVVANEPEMAKIGVFLKWIADDVEREESDVLSLMDKKLRKAAMGRVHNEAKKFFIAECRNRGV